MQRAFTHFALRKILGYSCELPPYPNRLHFFGLETLAREIRIRHAQSSFVAFVFLHEVEVPPLLSSINFSCAYCDATFHRGCCKLSPELIDAVLSNVNLHWSCIGCTNILKNPRCRSVKEIGAQVGF